MNILALDTSGPVCSVAIQQDEQLLYESRVINKLTHSQILMSMVDEALKKTGITVQQINTIAAVVGPGSFTGVRIGVAAAQGMARGLQISCIAINALESMARSIPLTHAVICPIRDARVKQVYGAAFQDGKRLINDQALKIDDFLELVYPLGKEFLFLGDGVVPCREQIFNRIGERARFTPAYSLHPGAAVAAYLAYHSQADAIAPGELKPLYLRAPQAERMRKNYHYGV